MDEAHGTEFCETCDKDTPHTYRRLSEDCPITGLQGEGEVECDECGERFYV